MSTTHSPMHSLRESSRRRKTYSPDHNKASFPLGMSKQTHHKHRNVSPSPIKDFPAPLRSVPDKRKQMTRMSPIQSPKRARLDHRETAPGRMQSPTKVNFFSSPRCPPSPHHKPRASSPLRTSAISPVVVIKRPPHRQPLGQLTVMLQGPDTSLRRITSKNNSPSKISLKSSPTKEFSTKRNDKENIDPLPRSKEHSSQDLFVRPQPRGPLTTLRRSDRLEESGPHTIVETKTVTVEEITTEYFVGAKIIREHQTKVSTEISQRTSDEFQSPLQTPFNKNSEFEIYQDEPGKLEMADYNSAVDNIMVEEEEDKENKEPGRENDSPLERKSRDKTRNEHED